MAAVTSAGRSAALEPLELAGGSHAAAALYERHSSSVFGYCLSRLGRREDAEDAVQTTFLHAVSSLRRGVVPTTEIAWLLGIARNVCLARRESVGRRSRLESPCDPVELDRGRAAPQGRLEELIGLEDALSQLPDQQRRAVLLRDWRGLSYEEIAVQLGVSHAAVETLIFRGRRTLAELLREEPQATRRRLRSLGELGSYFSATKTAFTSAMAATKVVMAAVTAVALSVAGSVVIGTSIHGGGTVPVDAPEPGPAPASVTPQPRLQLRTPALPPPAARQVPATRSPAPGIPTPIAQPATAANAPVAAAPAGEPVTRAPSSSSEPQGAAQSSQPRPAPVVAVPPAAEALPTVGAVEQAVGPLLPNLPVEAPSLPLPPVAVPPAELPDLPALVVDPLVTETLPTVELSPPQLLP